MAMYVVTYSDDDLWGERSPGAKRYKYHPPAEDHLAHDEKKGAFAILVRWEHHAPKIIKTVNAPADRISK